MTRDSITQRSLTLNQFLAELAKTPRTWRVYGEMIRSVEGYGGRLCPIQAVAALLLNHRVWYWPLGWQELGLRYTVAMRIVRASDRSYGTLRAQIEKACGLTS